jgi:hypothetical protein
LGESSGPYFTSETAHFFVASFPQIETHPKNGLTIKKKKKCGETIAGESPQGTYAINKNEASQIPRKICDEFFKLRHHNFLVSWNSSKNQNNGYTFLFFLELTDFSLS